MFWYYVRYFVLICYASFRKFSPDGVCECVLSSFASFGISINLVRGRIDRIFFFFFLFSVADHNVGVLSICYTLTK